MQLNSAPIITGAASAARTDSAINGFLRSESAALDYCLVRALHVVLDQKIVDRLAELDEMLPPGRSLCWGYPFFVAIFGQALVTHLEARP